MIDWLRQRGILLLSSLFLLFLLGLILVAGLAQGELWVLALVAVAALAAAASFALGLLRLVYLPQEGEGKGLGPQGTTLEQAKPLQEKLKEQETALERTREQILQLTQNLRRKSDQLTTDRDRAEFLHQSFTELASSLEPRRVLYEILQRAIEIAGARRGSIFLFDEQGQPSEVFLARMGGKAQIGRRTQEILDKGLVGWVVRNLRGEIIYDTEQDSRWLSFPEDRDPSRSAVAVPFLRRERVLGVMILTHNTPFKFNEAHLALLRELAQQSSICLENADLYTIAEGERRKLAAILSGTTDATIVVDMAGHTLLLNRAAEQAFQVQAQEALGRPLNEVIPHQGLADLLSQATELNETVSGELAIAEDRICHGGITPIPGVGWVAILHDITYLKELDRMKSDFVATVSHDLRSPLTTVRGFADLISMMGNVTEEQEEALGKIRRAVEQMNALIEDLLDLGKIEAGIDMTMSPFQIEHVVTSTVKSLLPRAELKSHRLQVDLNGPLPQIVGNASRLRQVLANLLDNAIKYTPEGGMIRVRLSRQERQIVVAVEDNGWGIPPQNQGQLFQKFYRVRAAETKDIPGTGLGLAIARSIVEQHRGRIWVESEPGRGSTFAFSLPIPEQGED